MSSFDWASLRHVRPVAAADYWVDGKSSLMRWFSMEIIGVIPVRPVLHNLKLMKWVFQ